MLAAHVSENPTPKPWIWSMHFQWPFLAATNASKPSLTDIWSMVLELWGKQETVS